MMTMVIVRMMTGTMIMTTHHFSQPTSPQVKSLCDQVYDDQGHGYDDDHGHVEGDDSDHDHDHDDRPTLTINFILRQ